MPMTHERPREGAGDGEPRTGGLGRPVAGLCSFCLLAVAVPVGARAYVRGAERRERALVESVVGTVVVEPAVGSGAVPIGKDHTMDIAEGTVVRVDETSEAVITFFDFSNVHLSPGTTVRVDVCAAALSLGVGPSSIHLSCRRAGAHGTALALHPLVPRGDVRSVTSADGRTVEATNGARISPRTASPHRGPGQLPRCRPPAHADRLGQGPGPPPTPREPADQRRFPGPARRGWQIFDQVPTARSVDGTVGVVVDDQRRRAPAAPAGGQPLRDGARAHRSRRERPPPRPRPPSRCATRASPGRVPSSEFPLMIRITYRDAYDSQAEWVRGF